MINIDFPMLISTIRHQLHVVGTLNSSLLSSPCCIIVGHRDTSIAPNRFQLNNCKSWGKQDPTWHLFAPDAGVDAANLPWHQHVTCCGLLVLIDSYVYTAATKK